MTCPRCGHEGWDDRFCGGCGHELAGSAARPRRRFAAEPDERAVAVRVVSTLLPRLPSHDAAAFRVALASGLALVVGLGIAGLFPLGLVAATVLVPLLLAFYLYDVDVYEDEPWLIVGLTMAWGVLVGFVGGIVLQHLPPTTDSAMSLVVHVVVVPVADLVVGLLGTVVLLRHPRFNDVLDGAFFASASLAALVATQTLVAAWGVTELGLTPEQDRVVAVLRLIEIGILVPVAIAGAAGWVGAAFWLRWRVRQRKEHALGVAGSPLVATLVAVALVVGTAFVRVVTGEPARIVGLALLASGALVLLRRAIHLGLLEEADEHGEGPPSECANCGRPTPNHRFCVHCGVAQQALPKRPVRGGPVAGSGPAPPDVTRRGRRVVVATFWGALALIVGAAAVVAVVNEADPDLGLCPGRRLCANPPTGPVPPIVSWASQPPTIVVRYSKVTFRRSRQSDTTLELDQKEPRLGGTVRARVTVTAHAVDDGTPAELVQSQLNALEREVPDLVADTNPRTTVGDFSIAGQPAVGGSYRGVADSAEGPTGAAVVFVGAATNGRATVVVSQVLTGTTDPRIIESVRSDLASLVGDVRWAR